MNCLLVAATAKEILPFIDHYRNSEKSFFVDINIDILISGIGLTATSYQLTRHFCLKRPDLVIQAGVAGCFDKKIPLGSVVAVKQEAIADEGVMESKKIKTVFDLKLVPGNQPPYKNGWLINPNTTLLKRSHLKAVKGISVNQISTDKKILRLYKDRFDPAVESMEGAALHYVCQMEDIPFLQVRGLSNYTGERNKKNWELKKAITNLNYELIRLFENL